MKLHHITLLFVVLSYSFFNEASASHSNDSLDLYQKGNNSVNQCTPWHHLQCVVITGTEVYEDGRDGKKGRHWWRMSYIGKACTDKHGRFLGIIFEGIWAVPHYTGVVIGSGFGWAVFSIRGPRDPVKIAKRQQKRKVRKAKRKQLTHLQ